MQILIQLPFRNSRHQNQRLKVQILMSGSLVSIDF